MTAVLSLLLVTLPFFVILVLANLADRERFAGTAVESSRLTRLHRWAFGLLGGLYVVMICVGIFVQVSAASSLGATLIDWFTARASGSGADGAATLGLLPNLLAGNVASPLLAGLSLWLSGLIGLILMLPGTRRLAARFLPLDAGRAVHAVALSMVALVLANLLFTLGIGLGNLGELISGDTLNSSTLVEVWAQQLFWALLALVGVGWMTRRDLRGALGRLALTWPGGQGMVVAVGLSISAVFGVIALQGIAVLLGFGPDPEVSQLSQELIGPLTQSLVGVLTLGLAAAIGEETLLRGALQPRFGLVATAVVFALLHSNYGITFSTLVVFLLGLLLGLVRHHYSTIASMVVHALYNMSLGLLAYLAARLVT